MASRDNGSTIDTPATAEVSQEQLLLQELSGRYAWLHQFVCTAFSKYAKHPASAQILDRVHFATTELEVSHFHIQQAINAIMQVSPENLNKIAEEALAKGDVVVAGAPGAKVETGPALTVVEGGKKSEAS